MVSLVISLFHAIFSLNDWCAHLSSSFMRLKGEKIGNSEATIFTLKKKRILGTNTVLVTRKEKKFTSYKHCS